MNKRFTTYLGSLVFLFSVLLATISPGSTAHAALPGQVGDAPRCTVESVGPRDGAFKVSGNDATVSFKVSGGANCKVRVSTNSFYAPTMNGKPYDQQILFQRITKVYDKAGTYSITAALPPKSTEAKGCFYQVDLTYGTHNITPVLAYGHGTLDCSVPQQPTFQCVSLKVDEISRTKRAFTAEAKVSGGATIEKYEFGFGDGFGITIPSNTYTYDYKKTGTFTTSVVVHVKVNSEIKKVTSPACRVPATIKPEPVQPVFACTALMARLISKEARTYGFDLTYTAEGGAALRDVDFAFGDGTSQNGATPTQLSTVQHSFPKEGKYTTIATLHFTITGTTQVQERKCEVTFEISPETCPLNPSLPKNSPDCQPCPLPGKENLPKGSPDCKETPQVLAATGPADMALGGLGLGSLTAAGYYWRASRNRLIAKLLGR